MKGVSVSLKDESNTVLTSGLTDSNGMITFSYNTNISRKNYTKITYKNTIKEGIYCNNTLPDAYTSSQIKLSSYTPNELYYLEVSPASPLSDDRLSYSNYQTISISFCPNNSTSEQLFIDCNLSKIPTTKIKSLYANTDTISSYINTDSTINNSQGSFRTCLYQEDGCQITSTTIPFVNLSFSSHQVQLTNALNSFLLPIISVCRMENTIFPFSRLIRIILPQRQHFYQRSLLPIILFVLSLPFFKRVFRKQQYCMVILRTKSIPLFLIHCTKNRTINGLHLPRSKVLHLNIFPIKLIVPPSHFLSQKSDSNTNCALEIPTSILLILPRLIQHGISIILLPICNLSAKKYQHPPILQHYTTTI